MKDMHARLSLMAEDFRALCRQMDKQFAGEEEIRRALRVFADEAEEDVRRMRDACRALEDVTAVFAGAEHAALQAAEMLPAGIAERGLIFEDWFSDLLRAEEGQTSG